MLRILIVVASLALAGCVALQPVRLTDLPSPQPVNLAAAQLSIVDLTKAIFDVPAGMGIGFHRISDRDLERPAGELLAVDLRRRLRASGGAGAIEVWVIDAGFYWEKTGVDFVPIVNLFTFQLSGRLKCEATVSVRKGPAEAVKRTVEHLVPEVDTSGLATGDSILKNAIRTCYPGLVDKVVAQIGGAVAGSKQQ